MFNTDRYFIPLDRWLMRHFFQAFTDFTYRWFKLTCFFWAGFCLTTVGVLMLYKGYQGLIIEGDPMIILALIVGFGLYLPMITGIIKRIWYQVYDDATYGFENFFSGDAQKARTASLSLVFMVTLGWSVISLRNNNLNISDLCFWILMTQYPVFSFASCNVPGRRF